MAVRRGSEPSRTGRADAGQPVRPGYQLYSDNCAGMCPEARAALFEADAGFAAPYAEDDWTRRAREQIRELFETDCAVFFLLTGTAANACAIAHLCRSFQSVLCARTAHVEIGECGATGFFGGGIMLRPIDAPHGKLTPEAVRTEATRRQDIEMPPARVLSLTQATELGTVYTPDEVAALAGVARECGLRVHMDGARLANALSRLDLPARCLTWEAGVDVVCLGGTKTGMAFGEAVVFFRPDDARDFEYRWKQSGQLASKMRYAAATWCRMLETGAWLRHARHANACADRLACRLAGLPQVTLALPVEANAVFVRMPPGVVEGLRRRGWRFSTHVCEGTVRLMCSWATTDAQIDAFLADVHRAVDGQCAASGPQPD